MSLASAVGDVCGADPAVVLLLAGTPNPCVSSRRAADAPLALALEAAEDILIHTARSTNKTIWEECVPCWYSTEGAEWNLHGCPP